MYTSNTQSHTRGELFASMAKPRRLAHVTLALVPGKRIGRKGGCPEMVSERVRRHPPIFTISPLRPGAGRGSREGMEAHDPRRGIAVEGGARDSGLCMTQIGYVRMLGRHVAFNQLTFNRLTAVARVGEGEGEGPSLDGRCGDGSCPRLLNPIVAYMHTWPRLLHALPAALISAIYLLCPGLSGHANSSPSKEQHGSCSPNLLHGHNVERVEAGDCGRRRNHCDGQTRGGTSYPPHSTDPVPRL